MDRTASVAAAAAVVYEKTNNGAGSSDFETKTIRS